MKWWEIQCAGCTPSRSLLKRYDREKPEDAIRRHLRAVHPPASSLPTGTNFEITVQKIKDFDEE